MKKPEYYETDILRFFDERPEELALYEALTQVMDASFPDAAIKVQKTQISFYGRHLFAAASLPLRRKKDWPKHSLLVTIGLPYRLTSPRVAVAVEPYPGRWTHHVLLSEAAQADSELLGWLREAYAFAESKR